ncbi:MAG: hypothetical protein WD403_12605 [Pirellulales bacterium]
MLHRQWPTAMILCLALAVCRETAAAQRSVVFILDCSANMAGTMASGGGQEDEQGREVQRADDSTRMEAAKDVLKTALTTLASEGDRRVAVWLFGHRLAWDQSDDPQLIEQTRYLDESQGFQVLESLLPGDDVELMRPLDEFLPRDLEQAFALLDAVEPWGESPLYLAMVRALDNLQRRASRADTTLVVITDGRNKQWIGQHKTGKNNVLDAIERRPVAVHVIAVGQKSSLQSEAELRSITSASGGLFTRAVTAGALADVLDGVLSGRAQGELQAQALTQAGDELAALQAGVGGGAMRSLMRDAAPGASAPAALNELTLKGQVTYYRRPVRRMRVILEGSGLPAAITDADGQYEIDNVVPGSYTLKCEGVYKNIIREHQQAITIDPAETEMLLVDVRLE